MVVLTLEAAYVMYIGTNGRYLKGSKFWSAGEIVLLWKNGLFLSEMLHCAQDLIVIKIKVTSKHDSRN